MAKRSTYNPSHAHSKTAVALSRRDRPADNCSRSYIAAYAASDNAVGESVAELGDVLKWGVGRAGNVTSSAPSSEADGTSRRIMLVDDEEDITTSLTIGLSKHGFEVTPFNDPLVALARFRPGFYDLVVSDIRMPNMNGFELAFELKKIDPKQRIVFITAFMDVYAELRRLFDRMDVLDVIQKPIGIGELARKLSALDSSKQQAKVTT